MTHNEQDAQRYLDYKKMALLAARELFYGESVISKIQNAKTDNEIYSIMSRARMQN